MRRKGVRLSNMGLSITGLSLTALSTTALSTTALSITALIGLLLSSCSLFGLGRATPTPAANPAVVERYLTSAPLPLRATATPMAAENGITPPPRGLPLPLVDPLNVSGDLAIAGSPALGSLTRRLYESFVRDGYRDTMTIEEIDVTAAFERYCKHTPTASDGLDIVIADRPMTQRELEECFAQNRHPVALRVAQGAVVVVSHMENDFLTAVNKDELASLFTVRRWSYVRSAWPTRTIERLLPPVNEMTTALFVEKILRHNLLSLQNAPTTTFLADGEEIAFAIGGTPNTLGLLNYADFQANAADLRLIAVNGIRPNGQSIAAGNYLLTYPLLIYTDLETLAAKGRVGAFLMYYLAHMNGFMAEVGIFPINEAVYERTKVILLTALGQEGYLDQFPPTRTPTPLTPTLTMTPTLSVIVTTTGTVAAD